MSGYPQFKMLDTKHGLMSITVTVDGVTEELHLLRNNMLVAVTPDENGNTRIYDTVEDYPFKVAYCGLVKDDYCPHGHGTRLYNEDSPLQKYVGDFSEGILAGNGVMSYKDGTVADGTFHCEEGITVFCGKKMFPNGDVVFGEWQNDKLEDVAKVDFADGRRIFGAKRQNGCRLLTGEFYLPGKGTFSGTIKMDFFEPYNGTIHFLGGRVYTGDCCFLGERCFCIHGKGKMTLTDGSSYSGRWVLNEIDTNAYGKLTLVGELSGEICGLPTHCGLMRQYLRCEKFSVCGSEVAEEQEESEAAEEPEEEEPEEDESETTEEHVPANQVRYHYEYDPDDAGYERAREDWGENAARKEGLERLAKKEERKKERIAASLAIASLILRESKQHNSV